MTLATSHSVKKGVKNPVHFKTLFRVTFGALRRHSVIARWRASSSLRETLHLARRLVSHVIRDTLVMRQFDARTDRKRNP